MGRVKSGVYKAVNAKRRSGREREASERGTRWSGMNTKCRSNRDVAGKYRKYVVFAAGQRSSF
jgi:hypothetical protein